MPIATGLLYAVAERRKNPSAADADRRLRAVAARYPRRRSRVSVAPVRELLERAGVRLPAARIAVVGTNGKTSTATYLARMLEGGDARVALMTSPHVLEWSERLTLGGVPIAPGSLAAAVERLDAATVGLTRRDELRFFDLLTLAASELAVAAGCDVLVLEAGIGGRLDAVAALDSPLVVLTSVALDHADLLGGTEPLILREKVGIAPHGATLVAAVGETLRLELERLAARADLRLELVDPSDGTVLERSLRLAGVAYGCAVALFGLDAPAAPPTIELRLVARRQWEVVGGIEVLLDGAHNPAAWAALLDEVGNRPFVALVAAPADRDPALLATLGARGAVVAVATEPWPGRSLPLARLAAELERGGLEVVREPNPRAAFRVALALARPEGHRVLAFGSFHLLTHLLPASELVAAKRAQPPAAVDDQ